MEKKTPVSVLLIEDDDTSAKVTSQMLLSSDYKYEVTVVGRLGDAISILSTECKYDVVLLDLILPNGEGLEVFKKVSTSCDIPIIILSGHEDKAIECVKYGAQDYLVKPYYSADSLCRSIRYAIERHTLMLRYKKLVEGTNAAMYEIDLVNDKYLYISEVGAKKLGYTVDEVKNMSPWSLLTPESLEVWNKRYQKVLRGEEIPKSEEFEVVKKDGSTMWILTTADYIFKGDKLISSSVIAIDITDRKKQEEHLKSIYRTAPVGIGLVRDGRKLVYVNDRLCKMLGYNQEELLNRNASFIYPTKTEYEKVGRVKYSKIKESGIGIVETQFIRKNGEVIDVLLTSSHMDSDDPSKGTTFSVLDISKSKKLERELEKALNERIDSWRKEVGQEIHNQHKLDYVLSL